MTSSAVSTTRDERQVVNSLSIVNTTWAIRGKGTFALMISVGEKRNTIE